MKPNALRLDNADNVATVLQTVPAGEAVRCAGGELVTARQDIPIGYKVAIEAIPAGAVIRKYGQPIGLAGEAISPGDLVHTHNLNAVEERR